MPNSHPQFRNETVDFIKKQFPDTNTTILDVGPGSGTYAKALKEYKNIDACEIFERYVKDYDLTPKYREIFISDICSFDFDHYNLIIMGDILEHIDVKRSQELIDRIYDKCDQLIINVPYQYRQGEWGGNKHERHIQDDLTHALMEQRYPRLKDLFKKTGGGGHKSGVYIKVD
jgi:hypothetical protein